MRPRHPALPAVIGAKVPGMTTPTSTAQYTSDVCIVGNGAIAKTAALGFAQAGHSVTLLVPAPTGAPNEGAPATGGERPWDVRVYALNHTARDLLGALKVWDALDASRVAPVDAMAVNGDGKNGGSLGFDQLRQSVYGRNDRGSREAKAVAVRAADFA